MRKFYQVVFFMAFTTSAQAMFDKPDENVGKSINKKHHLKNETSHVRNTLKLHQNIISGCTAGVLDVVVNHPLWAIKIMMQNGEPLNFRPHSLYRGVISNTLTMIPLTTSRVAISSFLQKRSHAAEEEDSVAKLVLFSFIGGAMPSLFGGPTELLRNLEHKHRMDFWDIYKKYVTNKGYFRLFRGTPGVSIRDGIYTASFSALTPLMSSYFEHEKDLNKKISTLLSGIISGTFAAVASHPFDTIKVIQQARSMEQDLSMLSTVAMCYKEEDKNWVKTIKRIFRGMVPRGIRTISGVVVISTTISFFNEMFNKINEK